MQRTITALALTAAALASVPATAGPAAAEQRSVSRSCYAGSYELKATHYYLPRTTTLEADAFRLSVIGVGTKRLPRGSVVTWAWEARRDADRSVMKRYTGKRTVASAAWNVPAGLVRTKGGITFVARQSVHEPNGYVYSCTREVTVPRRTPPPSCVNKPTPC